MTRPRRYLDRREADIILALFRHLDGSQTCDETDLLPGLRSLHATAAAVAGALPLDEDVLLDTLAQVAQHHMDGGR